MEPFSELLDRTNHVTVDFLFAELSLAQTFLDVAATSGSPETAGRNRHNAQVAYDSVVKHLPKVMLTKEQTERVDAMLCSLRGLLEDAGAGTQATHSNHTA